MVTTLARERQSRAAFEDLRLEVGKRSRRPGLAVASLALVAVCAATFTSLYLEAGHQISVLVVARNVGQGATLKADDLVEARISVSAGLTPVPATDLDQVVGRTASVPLVSGTLLSMSELVAGSAPPAGEAVVGVAVKASQLPAGGVTPGQTVDVVLTGPPDSSGVAVGGPGTSGSGIGPGAVPGQPSLPSAIAADVTVSEVAPPSASSGGDTTVVSLLVPIASAPGVAAVSAAGQAALILVAPGS